MKRKSTPKTKTRSDTSARKRFASKETKEPKATKTGSYKGIEYESGEEHAFLLWAFELKAMGFIKSITRADSLLLCDAFVNSFVIQLKTKSGNGTQTLLQPHSYTAEFIIEWDYKKAKDRFVWCVGDSNKHDKLFIAHKQEDGKCISYIECKPSYDIHGMTRLFKVNQKFCWAVHKIFINLVKKDDLFRDTFTPREYLTTSTGKRRIIRWKVVSIHEYLNQR